VKTLTALLVLSASMFAVQANAGVICAFQTPDQQSFSFGYVEGSGQPPDYPAGMYRLYGFKSGGHMTKWDASTGGPAWSYAVTNGAWRLTSVDDTRRTIEFTTSVRVPGSTAVDFVAALHDKDGSHIGVCEIGGLI
jgi:hypothetical protein